MTQRKERGGCPLRVAAEVFGGEEALRKAADHRATFSMWKTRKAVPWGVVGPVLLTYWQTHAGGIPPESQLTAELERRVVEASEEHRSMMRQVDAALRLVQKARQLRRFRVHRARSKT
jgi:hypothetical protein